MKGINLNTDKSAQSQITLNLFDVLANEKYLFLPRITVHTLLTVTLKWRLLHREGRGGGEGGGWCFLRLDLDRRPHETMFNIMPKL